MTRCLTPPAVVCLMLAATACGSARPDTLPPRGGYELTVEVRNHNHNAATVYAYRSGFRDRVGFVEAANSETFSFRWPTFDVRFMVDFLAQGCVITESMAVEPGDDLLLVIRVIDSDGASRSNCR